MRLWEFIYKPVDEDLDVFVELTSLLAASGMCVNSALKKLYNWNGGEKKEIMLMLLYLNKYFNYTEYIRVEKWSEIIPHGK